MKCDRMTNRPKNKANDEKNKNKRFMNIKLINNWKLKRAFSNGLWLKKGEMFPYKKRKYIQVGFFGFVFLIQWGDLF